MPPPLKLPLYGGIEICVLLLYINWTAMFKSNRKL